MTSQLLSSQSSLMIFRCRKGMKKVAMMMAMPAPTPNATPTASVSVKLIFADPPFQKMRRARRKPVMKTVVVGQQLFVVWVSS